MIRIDIRPLWRFRGDTEREFDFRLVALLAELESRGKLTQAAGAAGLSYRHAWNLIGQWEAFFGAPLVEKEQGRGTRLTGLGRALLNAGRRAQARLAPELENLAAEFARVLNETLREAPAALAMHASHDYAVGLLHGIARDGGFEIDLQYRGSFDALASLRRGECALAGFHVPDGPLGELIWRRYREGLPADEFRLLRFVRRTQGLIVRAGNPKAIRGVADLCRADVRMVNRQRGSGTRALLEFLASREGLDRARMRGYDTEETTHGAVAALVAGAQADAGFGVQAAAAQYGLGFVPVCRESYFLAVPAAAAQAAPVRALRSLLRGERFRGGVAALAGYDAERAGEWAPIPEEALPRP